MKIYSIYDDQFKAYGKVIEGYDNQSIVDVLKEKTPMPDGVGYVPSERFLEDLPVANDIANNFFGGMPIQLGWCNGYNTKLNCLEYHRDSEINLGTKDFILLLAKIEDIENGELKTEKVKAFQCPANVMIEIFATALHYAPCTAKKGDGFKVLVGLPKNTNTHIPAIKILNDEDKLLWARNKWLIAHKDSAEAKNGAFIGLTGENIDIEKFI